MGEAARRKKAGAYPPKTARPRLRVVQHDGALYGVDHLERVFRLRLVRGDAVSRDLRDAVLASAVRKDEGRIVRPTGGEVVQVAGGA